MNPPEMQRAIIALRKDLRDAVAMLQQIQKRRYHEPNPDFYEYCAACGRSPHYTPPHTDDCIVPQLGDLLRRLTKKRKARR